MRLPLVASSFALALVLAVSADARNPNHETIRLNAADQAAARAAVVKRTDLGVANVWRGGATKPDLSANPTCPNYHPDLSRFVVTGAAASDWRSGLNEIQSQTEVLETAPMVQKEWQLEIEAPGAIPCLRSVVKKEFSTGGARFLSFERVSFPRIATHATAFLLSARASGIRVMVEIVLLAKGRTEIELELGGAYAARHAISSGVSSLARLLAQRVRT